AYPLPLKQLVEQTAAGADAKLVKQALAAEPFKSGVVLAVPKDPQTPAALAGDADRLVDSPQLLEFALEKARKPNVQAFPLKDLKKPLAKTLQPSFEEAVNRRLDSGSLPDTVGTLWIKTRHLFLLKDVQAPHSVPAAVAPAAACPDRRQREV